MAKLKSPSENKIEKALGIKKSDLSDIDNFPEDKSKEDIEKEIKEKERKEAIKKYSEKAKKFVENDLDDKDFCKTAYKNLIEDGLTMLGVLKEEILLDPSPRAVEVASGLMNSVGGVIKSIQDMDEFKEEMVLEKEKNDLKRNIAVSTHSALGNLAQGNMTIVASMADLVKKIKIEQAKDIEVTSVKDEDDNK